MPHPSTQLALVAVECHPHRHDLREHASPTAGPGWFDSSWDLRRGLEVRESWSDDERVHGWIEDFLRTQRTIDRIASTGAVAAVA